jgi:formate dehydrogenase alpha subunit
MKRVNVTIDGMEISANEGTTILRAAKSAGIGIPTLCFHERLRPIGSCGMCIVEVDGHEAPLLSCETLVADGMSVKTRSDRLLAMRQESLKAMLVHHPLDCPICDKAGDCRLQDLVVEHGITGVEPPSPTSKFEAPYSMAFIKSWPERCVLCLRCVHACAEIQGIRALSVSNGSDGVRIVYDKYKCVQCGECIQMCPVGALVEKRTELRWRTWDEDRKIQTTCPYCGVGCQQWLHVKKGKVVRVSGVEGAVPNDGRLCVKGRYGFDFIDHPDRLTVPLIKKDGAFQEASWDMALGLVAERLRAIKEASGPDALAFFSSARVTNEENYLMNKLARVVIGTNNIDHCARLCHASTVAGLATSFGSGAMTNSIEELERSDVVLITGSNTSEMHPVISSFIKRGVQSGRTRLIVVDPRHIDLVDHGALWLRQRPGTDVAWINGMMHVIIRENLYAKEYVAERTEGFDAVKELVAGYTPERVEAITSIPKADLIAAARLYASAPAASIVYAMGITQHINGTDAVKSTANLAMLCGNIGIESGGVNPLRGQNNVQGACDMGALPNVFSGYQAVTLPEMREKMAKAWNVRDLPGSVGLTMLEAMAAAAKGQIKGLYIMGENPMLSEPDIHHVEQELKSLDFLVVQDIFLTETARLADVVLPSACFAEKDGTFTNTERRVQLVRKVVEPPGKALPDWEILSAVATKLGYSMSYANAEAIFDEMAGVTPSYGGMDYRRLAIQGLQWPCPTKDHPGTGYLHREKFARGKGLFSAVEWIPPAEPTDEEYPFVLTTGRVLYHYHTGSMTRRSAGLNAICPECWVEINPGDAVALDIRDGEIVGVRTRRGRIEAKAKVGEMTDARTIFIPFHFWEAAANRLTIAAVDPIAKIPEFKVCAAKVEKLKPAGRCCACH